MVCQPPALGFTYQIIHNYQTSDFGGNSSIFCFCTADSQADEDLNKLNNNQKITEFTLTWTIDSEVMWP